MAVQIINQKKAVELLKKGEHLTAYQVSFNQEMVESLDALLLRKNGIPLPTSLVFYDDDSIDFDEDEDLTDSALTEGRLVQVLRAELALGKEITDWVHDSNININGLLTNLVTDFYKNLKTKSLSIDNTEPRTMHGRR